MWWIQIKPFQQWIKLQLTPDSLSWIEWERWSKRQFLNIHRCNKCQVNSLNHFNPTDYSLKLNGRVYTSYQLRYPSLGYGLLPSHTPTMSHELSSYLMLKELIASLKEVCSVILTDPKWCISQVAFGPGPLVKIVIIKPWWSL